jgi:hypothetical protein
VCGRLWRGLAEDNGWRLPTDAEGDVVAEAKQRVKAKLHGLLVAVSAPTPEQPSSAEVRQMVVTAPNWRCDATRADSASERECRIGRGSGMGATTGVWKEWYVVTMMERVLTGKRERRTLRQRTSGESGELGLEAKRTDVDQQTSATKLRIVLVTTTDRGEVPACSLGVRFEYLVRGGGLTAELGGLAGDSRRHGVGHSQLPSQR